MNRDTGQFSALITRKWIQCGTGDDFFIAFNQGEMLNFSFQQFPRTVLVRLVHEVAVRGHDRIHGSGSGMRVNRKKTDVQQVCTAVGADVEAAAENRDRFRHAMTKLGLDMPVSDVAHNMEEAWKIQALLGFPTVIRPSFTLGGSGGGIAYNKDEFEKIWNSFDEFEDDETGLGYKAIDGIQSLLLNIKE